MAGDIAGWMLEGADYFETTPPSMMSCPKCGVSAWYERGQPLKQDDGSRHICRKK